MEIIVALSSKIFPRNCENLLSLRWCVKNWKSKPLAVAGLYQLSSFLAETPPSNNNLKALGSVYGIGVSSEYSLQGYQFLVIIIHKLSYELNLYIRMWNIILFALILFFDPFKM